MWQCAGFKEWRNALYIGRKTEMYIVKSLELANWLCNRGYRILKVEDSEKNPRFKVFLFEDTKQIRSSVSEYLLQKRG